MIRSEPVNQEDLINFIKPDIFDPEFTFGYGTPQEQLDRIQIQSEVSNLL